MSHPLHPQGGDAPTPPEVRSTTGVHAPLEGFSSYRGADWSPQKLAFHQNLEQFADRIGLIVALQAGGKLQQDDAYAEIRSLWKQLDASREHLLDSEG
ncbi:DUF7219 family protein [Vulcanococcus limneticus]|uniref:DUF7219 family protein n=1 Tax=Vulcanococcus limneticus TaxID=2170428 RepID=UPI001E5797F6|nr:hypothetical protein [Vulcanococcus limneticus]